MRLEEADGEEERLVASCFFQELDRLVGDLAVGLLVVRAPSAAQPGQDGAEVLVVAAVDS